MIIKIPDNITSLAVHTLIVAHKDFKDLLWLISLIGRENIPKELLNAFKDKRIVDNFIHYLNQNCFLTYQPSFTHSLSNISLHYRFQKTSLTYLTKKFLRGEVYFFQRLVDTLECYMIKIIEAEDFVEMESLVSHCKIFLSYQTLLIDTRCEVLLGELGEIYHQLGYYQDSQKFLEKAFKELKKGKNKNYLRIARVSYYLGEIHRSVNNPLKAIKFFKYSLEI